jgi:hypothetical protein
MSEPQIYGLFFAALGVGTVIYGLFVKRRLGTMRGTRTLNIADLAASSNGRNRRRSRTVEEETSAPYFNVRDATGVAVLDLRGTHVDSPAPAHRSVVPVEPGGFKQFAIEFLRDKRDQELVYSEVVVAPNTPVYALGKGGPHPQTGAPTLTEPDSGPFIVSTRSEEQLSKRTHLRAIASYVVGGLLFVGGGITAGVASLF